MKMSQERGRNSGKKILQMEGTSKGVMMTEMYLREVILLANEREGWKLLNGQSK